LQGTDEEREGEMDVLIGAAAGAVAAAVCALFYRKGVKDGMKLRKTAGAAFDEGGEDAGSELMRKYELIMGYDPYGTPGGGYGERV
jgi:hypothetical protein